MTDQTTIQDNGDGTGTITIAGVPITPYVAPINPPATEPPSDPPVDSAPPSDPPPLAAGFTFALDADGATVHFHDTSTGAARIQWQWGDGGSSNKPGDQDKWYRYPKTYTVKQQVWDAGGKTQSFSAQVTTAAGGTSSPPPPPADDPPPSDPTPVSPPPPPVVYANPHAVKASTTIDGVSWTAIATVGEDPTVMGDFYRKFVDLDGNVHPALRLLAWADCCEVGAVNGRSGLGCIGSLTIEYDGEVVWDASQVLFFCGTLNKTIRYGKFQPTWKAVPDGLFPNYAKPAAPLQVNLQKYDWSYNGAGYANALAQATTGQRPEIAVIPPPDIPFVLDPSDETYAWVRQTADNDGAWAIARLDDDTGLPFDVTQYPGASLLYDPSYKGNPIAQKASGDGIPVCPTVWDEAHHTGYGFVAAAATGSARDRLHAAILGNAALTALNPWYRQQCGVFAHYQERGTAWALRSIFYASRISCMTDYFVAQLDVQRQQGERQITSTMGMQGTYVTRTFPDGSKGTAQWEENFTRAVLGVIAHNDPAWETLRAQMAKGISLFLTSPQYQLATGYTLAWQAADGTDKTTLAQMLTSTLSSWSADDVAIAISPDVTTAQMSALIAKYQAGWAGKVGDFAQYPYSADGYPAILRAATASNFAADSPEWKVCDGVPTKPDAGEWVWNIVPRT